MTGTIINIIFVLIGGGVGLFFGNRLPERVKQTVMAGLGLFTLVIGISMFLDTQNPVTVLLALLFGGLLGEWWQIERGLERFSAFMEMRFAGGDGGTESRFVIGMTRTRHVGRGSRSPNEPVQIDVLMGWNHPKLIALGAKERG